MMRKLWVRNRKEFVWRSRAIGNCLNLKGKEMVMPLKVRTAVMPLLYGSACMPEQINLEKQVNLFKRCFCDHTFSLVLK